MPTRTKRKTAARRHDELRAMLVTRRRELTDDVHGRMRDVRSRSVDDRDVVDTHDGADVDSQSDLDLALIQMKAEALNRIDAALRRLDADTYGNCLECAEAISRERLKALPFAVRCTACEEAREKSTRMAARLPRSVNSYRSFDTAD